MIDSITPTWDGNETWLIMTGVTLLAGFPIAYGILMPAFYVPLVIMLLALGLRGVSFEFRSQTKGYQPALGCRFWSRVDCYGMHARTYPWWLDSRRHNPGRSLHRQCV